MAFDVVAGKSVTTPHKHHLHCLKIEGTLSSKIIVTAVKSLAKPKAYTFSPNLCASATSVAGSPKYLSCLTGNMNSLGDMMSDATD